MTYYLQPYGHMQKPGSSPCAYAVSTEKSGKAPYRMPPGMQDSRRDRIPPDSNGSPAVLKNSRENRSPRTVQTYESHARPFIEAYCDWRCPQDACSDPFSALTPGDWAVFPIWFVKTYRNAPWCRQTLKLVKISLRYVLGGLIGDKGAEIIRSFRPATVQRKGTAGMSLHEKNPDPRRIQVVLAFLDSHGTFLAALAAAWFRAQLVCGLRPKEWAFAIYREAGSEGILTIINGKQNGMLRQGTGFLRQLVFLGSEQEPDRRIIREFVSLKEEYYRQYSSTKGYSENRCFTSMLRNCQEMYRKANNELRMGRPVSMNEKNITLYSLRDAFKADAFSLAEPGPERRRRIAALMGHSSLFSQDMYAPENRGTGRAAMPAVPGRQTITPVHTDRRNQEDVYAGKKEIQADRCGPSAQDQCLRP